jgi:hypothetical protein
MAVASLRELDLVLDARLVPISFLRLSPAASSGLGDKHSTRAQVPHERLWSENHEKWRMQPHDVPELQLAHLLGLHEALFQR